jgi:hypothetical protein
LARLTAVWSGKASLGKDIKEKNMGSWELGNRVSEIGYKLDSLAGIAELVAERITDNAESGACWTLAEILRMHGEKLEELSSDIMKLKDAVEETKKKK